MKQDTAGFVFFPAEYGEGKQTIDPEATLRVRWWYEDFWYDLWQPDPTLAELPEIVIQYMRTPIPIREAGQPETASKQFQVKVKWDLTFGDLLNIVSLLVQLLPVLVS